MKVYRVGFLNSDGVGLFTNKKTARKYLRKELSHSALKEGYIESYTISPLVAEGEKIPRSFAVSACDYHKGGRLMAFLLEYIDERFDRSEIDECYVMEGEKIK